MLHRVLAIIFLLLTGQAPSVWAQGLPSDYVTWNSTISSEVVAPGDLFSIELKASIAEGWKLYAMNSPSPSWNAKLQLDALPTGITQVGKAMQSTPREAFDKYFKSDVAYFLKEATLGAQFQVTDAVDYGLHAISGKVGYQICNDELGICLPPRFEVFALQLDVVEERAAGSEASGSSFDFGLSGDSELMPLESDEAGGGDAATEITAASSNLRKQSAGLWGFILLAVGAGLGALLMPCVFPMIPLTVSYFTKHAHNRSEAVRMASVYGLAIVVIFTGLGILMAILIGASGAQLIAANPWVNLFIGLVFIVFALSLLGLFELRLPNSLLNYFNRQSNQRRGYTGVLFMGTTLTLVSFSCTAPFVGTLLAATAGGEWIYPVVGMLIFSATFAFPFVLFALFPNGLSRLPESGSWMNTLKVVFGFIELAAAIKFLSNADLVWGWNFISRPMAISATVVILFLTGMYLIGKLRLMHEEPVQQIGTARLIVAIGFFGLSLYMLPGLFGAPLNNLDAYLPPRQGSDVSLVASLASTGRNAMLDEENWFESRDLAYAEASELGKPVFIDFTGYTCTNCRQMEANVFPHPAVADRFEEDYVLLRLYTDDLEEGPELQKFQLELTGTVALPTYAIVDPASGSLIGQRSGVQSVERFSQFLASGAEVFASQYLAASQ